MSQVDGSYDCVTKSPMGDQKSVFTVNSDGGSFTGQNAGAMGSLDVEATIDGDALTGTIKAGAFGSMAMTGTRQG